MTSPHIITLLTDFGLADAYVGIMKGVILSIASAAIVDISHEVHPQNVAQGAFLLRAAYRYFPVDTIHVGVVDPGVGTSRRALAIETAHGFFVGPDNGLFEPALVDQGALEGESGELRRGTAVELTNDRYWHHPVSQTFHGRDIFAPAAAHLAAGVPLTELGPPVHILERRLTETARLDHGYVYGTIVHIDRFGNAISNVPASMVPPNPVFEMSGRVLHGLARSYQEGPIVALVGSTGFVEIAARNGSAANALGLSVGDGLVVRSTR